MTQRWRYLVLAQTPGLLSYKWDDPDYADLELDAALNRAGREGWELVSVFTHPMTAATTFVFKKPN